MTDRVVEQFLACSGTPYNQRHGNARWGTGYTSPTDPGAFIGNLRDWGAARRWFLDGLVKPTLAERDAALAQTFQSLGQVLHLVQDLAVPAHVRNDFGSHFDFCYPRLVPLQPVTSWCENAFERYVRLHPEVITAGTAVAADPGAQVVRFWDTGEYQRTRTPSADLARGLAEYTSANFLSLNTVTMDTVPSGDPYYFPHPSEASTTLPDLVPQRLLVREVRAEDFVVDRGLYIDRTGAGERVVPLAKVGYLWGDLIQNENPGPFLPLTLQLDEHVHAAYATLLLPKAVAYSAGLLDYFFRGKLDVDLVGPDEAGTYALVGTNASAEALRDGTLTLYADDPTTGARTAVEGVAALSLDEVPPGGPLVGEGSPAAFVLPDAERFVAVYTGTLGAEAKQDATDTPGAVIGKVLGGVRVEELFPEAGRWNLRSPTGVYPLAISTGTPAAPVLEPLTTAAYEWLRWGDAEHLLVGLTAATEPPVHLVVFTVTRDATSGDLLTVPTPEGPTVPVTETRRHAFPFDLPLGTRVTQRHRVHYRQPLVKVERVWTYAWQPPTVDAEGRTVPGYYRYDGEEYPPPQIATPVDEALPFAASVELTLAAAQSPWGPAWSPYLWWLDDIGVDATGTRLLAVVAAMPNTWDPDYPPRQTRPVYGLTASGGLEQTGTVALGPGEPQEIWVWALVDVTAGRVLATTAPAEITFTTTQYADATPGPAASLSWCTDSIGYWRRHVDRYVGGPTPHDEPQPWEAGAMGMRGCHRDPEILPDRVTELVQRRGTAEAHLTVLRPALVDAFPNPGQLDFTTGVTHSGGMSYLYWCGTGYCTLRLAQDWWTVRQYPVELDLVRRARPAAAAGEQFVLLPTVWNTTGTGTVPLLTLRAGASPESAHVAVPFQFPAAEFDWKESGWDLWPPLVDATGESALVAGESQGAPVGYLVALDGTAPPLAVSTVDFRGAARLFAPRSVYHTGVQRFYRLPPPTGPTALPRRLFPHTPADAPSWFHDYHLVRLR